ncbi:MAG: leucine-rich repeat domain-containing protein [Lachnospiraceae bacterium]|nr:leucine-rich repeat domain-containing protein [Lachnospiraceae bacterium]
MKKLLVALFSAAMILACAGSAFAEPADIIASGRCGAASWTLVGETLSISGSGAMRNYGNRTEAPWNAYKDDIETVVIGPGVTLIGNYAFSGMTKLSSVILGENVTTIGICAFSDCTALQEITIPASVATIGNYAFYRCTSLTSAGFEADTLPSVSEKAFASISPLVSVGGESYHINLAGSVGAVKWTLDGGTLRITGIGNMRGYGNKTQVPWYEYADEIETVVIGYGVTCIGNYDFAGLTALTSVTLPDALSKIGTCAFSGCSSLTEITIPSTVTAIDKYAFNACKKLQTISFEGDAPTIDERAFSGVRAKAEYLCATEWSEEELDGFGGRLTWKSVSHNLVLQEQTDSTCKVHGHEEHYECSVCGRLYKDAQGLEETTAAEIELALLPHSYEDTWQENSGYHWHKCSVCGAKDSTEAHVYSSQNDNSCNICGHIKGIEMPIIEF